MNNNEIKAMVLFKEWIHCEADFFEHRITKEFICFFPSEEKAREVAESWVKRGKETHESWDKFTANVIPLNKKFNGKCTFNRSISGFESDLLEIGDPF